jgi:hypothetical protein
VRLKSVVFAILLGSSIPAFTQLVKVEPFLPRRADTILIERNWRTRSQIILAELEFEKGDTVNPVNLGLSLKKIWNLQNFASVLYRWDTLPGGRHALVLVARDALTVRPILAGRYGDPNDWALKLGLADRNFLGRNINLELRGQLSPSETVSGEVKFTLPRQMLWKNMEAGLFCTQWIDEHRFEGYRQLLVQLVNPWHQDYRNTFSPDIETGLLTNYSIPISSYRLAKQQSGYLHPTRNFWVVRVSETIGTITHRRHQEEGFSAGVAAGAAIGLNQESSGFFEGGMNVAFHKLMGPDLQFSAVWAANLSNSAYNSLWPRLGPADIRGVEYGELWGRFTQVAKAGLFYTWLNRDFIALEQSLFVQYASARKTLGDGATTDRHFAIGTGFEFTVPMFPATGIRIAFSYTTNPGNWFYLEL